MSQFNPIERSIARILGQFPLIKKFVKSLYSRITYLFHKKKYAIKTTYKLSSFESGFETFFGYYDKSPVNSKGLVLGHLSQRATNLLASIHQPIEVALFSQKMANKIWSAKTIAYNWQQGSRLHWLDDELFIYNDFDTNKECYVSKVMCTQNLTQIKQFEYPVQDSFKTEYFLSLNYKRLMALRPDYGYRNMPDMSEQDLKLLNNDGIWRIDYQTGDSKLLVSLEQICSIKPKTEFSKALHKTNHVMISPDGTQFIFLHRYFIAQCRFDRLMLANAQTGELKVLSDYGMVSHCVWINNKTILGFMRGLKNKEAFWLVNISNNSFSHFTTLDGLGDGHPYVHGDWFVSDTYPDKSRMQHLNLVNWKTGELKKLGEFFHGFKYRGEMRCDLHPRFSPCGKKVYFDSIFSGERKLYEMEVNY